MDEVCVSRGSSTQIDRCVCGEVIRAAEGRRVSRVSCRVCVSLSSDVVSVTVARNAGCRVRPARLSSALTIRYSLADAVAVCRYRRERTSPDGAVTRRDPVACRLLTLCGFVSDFNEKTKIQCRAAAQLTRAGPGPGARRNRSATLDTRHSTHATHTAVGTHATRVGESEMPASNAQRRVDASNPLPWSCYRTC